jgi:hypothetical protein
VNVDQKGNKDDKKPNNKDMKDKKDTKKSGGKK